MIIWIPLPLDEIVEGLMGVELEVEEVVETRELAPFKVARVKKRRNIPMPTASVFVLLKQSKAMFRSPAVPRTPELE
jgi:hypothetical protein